MVLSVYESPKKPAVLTPIPGPCVADEEEAIIADVEVRRRESWKEERRIAKTVAGAFFQMFNRLVKHLLHPQGAAM